MHTSKNLQRPVTDLITTTVVAYLVGDADDNVAPQNTEIPILVVEGLLIDRELHSSGETYPVGWHDFSHDMTEATIQ